MLFANNTPGIAVMRIATFPLLATIVPGAGAPLFSPAVPAFAEFGACGALGAVPGWPCAELPFIPLLVALPLFIPPEVGTLGELFTADPFPVGLAY